MAAGSPKAPTRPPFRRDRRGRFRFPTSVRRGSVLVPVVAATLLLSFCGIALSELVAAHRFQSAVGIGSARAYWIAEAGVWHAAQEGTELLTPVAFAGGSYTVQKAGDLYVSTGRFADAMRVVSLQFRGSGSGTATLDEAASQATARRINNRRFEVDLVSLSPSDLVIESFALSASTGTPELHTLRLAGRQLWHAHGIFLPITGSPLNQGSTSDRTISANTRPTLRVEFRRRQRGTVKYDLTLWFTDGSSAHLSFSIDW